MAEATPRPTRIALVGHCGPDSYALRSAVGTIVPGSEVVFARDESALADELGRADLLLVNRTLDGDFHESNGIELIRTLRAGDARPRLMLVSNYPEAQMEAEAAGAAPGFGKSAMYSDVTRARLRAALGMS